MERFLDIMWEYIYSAILSFAAMVDNLLSPIHNLTGPAFILVLLALTTVFSTKFLGKKCRTKRHIMLEEEFNYWLGVREEAMRCEDREKGSRMAKNIDQAKLNRAYYDYFLEGLLMSFATMYLPILMVLSYVNAYYRPERLMELTGREYIVQFGSSSGDPVFIGSLFFYLVSLVSSYIGWTFLKKAIERHRRNKIIKELNINHVVAAK
ncbi:hypothetical protein UWK_02643 [Desulfocapsa sulfexigens DSM 10523]|uniref:DUF106 domain-containing protein n=1 Tax=Desulfocapsa sulfexigens (strain DSM 10523 / SB164P1) TaxID=1167006 RepID=M1NHV5_DESSD|nr:hypothetical protein [Desulfocapsa sulfexigens]AGF79179.1 hypothetical protein UWK_02643 [Desulfocapsa sulfexigens DSM 10523]